LAYRKECLPFATHGGEKKNKWIPGLHRAKGRAPPNPTHPPKANTGAWDNAGDDLGRVRKKFGATGRMACKKAVSLLMPDFGKRGRYQVVLNGAPEGRVEPRRPIWTKLAKKKEAPSCRVPHRPGGKKRAGEGPSVRGKGRGCKIQDLGDRQPLDKGGEARLVSSERIERGSRGIFIIHQREEMLRVQRTFLKKKKAIGWKRNIQTPSAHPGTTDRPGEKSMLCRIFGGKKEESITLGALIRRSMAVPILRREKRGVVQPVLPVVKEKGKEKEGPQRAQFPLLQLEEESGLEHGKRSIEHDRLAYGERDRNTIKFSSPLGGRRMLCKGEQGGKALDLSRLRKRNSNSNSFA